MTIVISEEQLDLILEALRAYIDETLPFTEDLTTEKMITIETYLTKLKY